MRGQYGMNGMGQWAVMHEVVSLSVSLSGSLVSGPRTLTRAGRAQRQRSVKSERRAAEAERARAEHYRAHCWLIPLNTHTHTHAQLVLDRIWCAVGRSYPVQGEPSQNCTLGSRPLHLKLIKTIMRFIACSCSVLSFPVISIQTKKCLKTTVLYKPRHDRFCLCRLLKQMKTKQTILGSICSSCHWCIIPYQTLQLSNQLLNHE